MVVKKQSNSGRKKIEIKKIKEKNHLQVTFSKRRSGLFKKACELCTLCGVEMAILVFSPANKAFSFGHPDVESLIDRFLARNQSHPQASRAEQLIKAHRNVSVHELNLQLTHVAEQLESEKRRGEELERIRKESQRRCWWENPIEKLRLHELEQLRGAMEELKKIVASQANKILIENSSCSSPFLGVNGFENFDRKPGEIGGDFNLPQLHNFGYGHEFQ